MVDFINSCLPLSLMTEYKHSSLTLLDKGVLPLLPFLNSGKQGKCICTCDFLRKSACWGTPPIPRQGLLALPCRTLHRRSGYAPLRALVDGRLDQLERSMLTVSGRTRSRPVRDDEKGRHRRLFSGVWVPELNKRFAGVCTLMHCLPLLFSVGSGFPPRMETAPA